MIDKYGCGIRKKQRRQRVGGKNMCEYCKAPGKEIKLHRQETDSNITECFIHIASDGAALFLRQQFVVGFTDDCKPEIKQLNDYVYADIEYCPICGRKLNND